MRVPPQKEKEIIFDWGFQVELVASELHFDKFQDRVKREGYFKTEEKINKSPQTRKAGTYSGDSEQCSLVGKYGTFTGVISVKARKLQHRYNLEDHECSIKKCVLH